MFILEVSLVFGKIEWRFHLPEASCACDSYVGDNAAWTLLDLWSAVIVVWRRMMSLKYCTFISPSWPGADPWSRRRMFFPSAAERCTYWRHGELTWDFPGSAIISWQVVKALWAADAQQRRPIVVAMCRLFGRIRAEYNVMVTQTWLNIGIIQYLSLFGGIILWWMR